MVRATGDKYGISGGLAPLKVVVPTFSKKTIQQSTPIPGARNVITVTLSANYHLADGSLITITGLSGSQTQSSTSFSVTSTAKDSSTDRIGNTANWDNAGSLVLTAQNGGIQSADFELEFTLENPGNSQSSPQVRIQASIFGGGSQIGSIAVANMTKVGTAVLGVPDGANPLRVVVPDFDVKTIRQSNPASNTSNKITVTLDTNYDLGVGSTVTISGLTGTLGPSATNISIATHYSTKFFGTSAAWNQTTGTIVLQAVSKMTSSDVLDVSFIVTNPAEDQNSPTISIAAIIKNLRGRLHITEPCFKPRQPCC